MITDFSLKEMDLFVCWCANQCLSVFFRGDFSPGKLLVESV